MEQEKIDKITKLSAIAFDKKQYFEALGMVNRAIDPEQRKKQYIEYELAKAGSIEADTNLANAKYE